MSKLGAFVQSRLGGFTQSRLGVRGGGTVASGLPAAEFTIIPNHLVHIAPLAGYGYPDGYADLQAAFLEPGEGYGELIDDPLCHGSWVPSPGGVVPPGQLESNSARLTRLRIRNDTIVINKEIWDARSKVTLQKVGTIAPSVSDYCVNESAVLFWDDDLAQAIPMRVLCADSDTTYTTFQFWSQSTQDISVSQWRNPATFPEIELGVATANANKIPVGSTYEVPLRLVVVVAAERTGDWKFSIPPPPGTWNGFGFGFVGDATTYKIRVYV